MPNYTVVEIRKALDEISRGSPIATAAAKYGIPRTTLSGKHHKVYPVETRKGPATILTEEEETHLENWIFHVSDAGFAITPDQLLDSVQRLVKELKRETPFTDGRPGRKWYKAFMKRHPTIVKKLSRNLSHPRTLVTKENITNWFQEVRDYLVKENLLDVLNDPKRIFNTDESAFFLCPKGDHVLVRKGSKMVFNFVMNDDKECLTALIGGYAAGDLMPSMVVYPYQRVPAVISESFPKTWAVGRSENGWMTSETFYEYVVNVFHRWLVKEKVKLPVILFVDGHTSHGSLHLSEFCQKNQIVLVALYPNSTHFTQPMDVSCFHPLKNGWKKEVRTWRFENEDIRLKRENFAPLLEKAIAGSIKPETITNGFRKCGLYPFTPEAINFEEMKVKSTIKEQVPIAQNDMQSKNENTTDHQIFVEWIEKAIPPELLHEFKNSVGGWTGNVEHKSLFVLWKKQFDLTRSANENTAEMSTPTNYNDINLQVVPSIGFCERENSTSIDIDDDETLVFDYESIPIVDFDQMESENIVIVDTNGVANYLSVESEYHEQIVDITELENANESVKGAHCDNGYSSSDDELSESDDSDRSSDTEAVKFTTVADTTTNDTVDRSDIDSSDVRLSIKEVEPNAITKNETTVNTTKSSNIPLGTPPAFANVLFYPGEKPLSMKRKRSRNKQKIPSVYSSEQYSEYLRGKQNEKEQQEKLKAERKFKREQESRRRKEEKKEREAKRLARKEAAAIKNAELTEKKANLAMKKAEAAAKKADAAAKKAAVKDNLPGATAPKLKKRKIDPEEKILEDKVLSDSS